MARQKPHRAAEKLGLGRAIPPSNWPIAETEAGRTPSRLAARSCLLARGVIVNEDDWQFAYLDRLRKTRSRSRWELNVRLGNSRTRTTKLGDATTDSSPGATMNETGGSRIDKVGNCEAARLGPVMPDWACRQRPNTQRWVGAAAGPARSARRARPGPALRSPRLLPRHCQMPPLARVTLSG